MMNNRFLSTFETQGDVIFGAHGLGRTQLLKVTV